MKPANWISHTGLSPCAAIPTDAPQMSSSASGGVAHAALAEAFEESFGGPEHAAVHPDVLAEHEHVGVLLHRAYQCEVHRLDERDFSHVASPPPTAAMARTAGSHRRADSAEGSAWTSAASAVAPRLVPGGRWLAASLRTRSAENSA